MLAYVHTKIVFVKVFATNVVLTQLPAKHIRVGTGAKGINHKANTIPLLLRLRIFNASSQLMCKSFSSVNLQTCANIKSSATHLLSLMSTHLQIPSSVSSNPWPIHKQLLTSYMPRSMTHCLLKQLISLNEICSAQNLLGSMQTARIYSAFFNIQASAWVSVPLFKEFYYCIYPARVRVHTQTANALQGF